MASAKAAARSTVATSALGRYIGVAAEAGVDQGKPRLVRDKVKREAVNLDFPGKKYSSSQEQKK
jgi:hypothetical protein